MSTVLGTPSVGPVRRRELQRPPWFPVWSKPAALRALRATIVMPGLFALADRVLGNLQIALFAGFGSFATLVLVTFAGTWRDKLRAHLGLALAGSVLLVIGTAVSGSTVVAALVTVPVAFAVFFSGVAGPNAATAVTGALLAYVLPAASAGTMSMVPDRLAGWWMASAAGTAAVLLIATPPTGDRLRASVAGLTGTIADTIEAALRGDLDEPTLSGVVDAKHDLLVQFNATPFRPTGLAIRDQALSQTVELLEWCASLVVDTLRHHADLSSAPEAARDLFAACAEILRTAGGLFQGEPCRPDLERLDECRTASLSWVRGLSPAQPGYEDHARLALDAHTLATSVLAVGADALIAARLVDSDWLAEARTRWFFESTPVDLRRTAAVRRYAGVAARHASVRSVWFVNSLRGALALAAAVAVAGLTGVQHGFWVVLGTLSVLRTTASATGATALRALLGTAVGFAAGAALLLAIGTGSTALWIALPVAVLIASYTPGTAPFALGQAAFTVTVAILFNVLVPVGWKVGELRVEDVALGCAVSVAVGALWWPRGVAPLVGDDLADAYRTGADYLRQAVEWVCGTTQQTPVAGAAAITAGARLDEALRGFTSEQGTKLIPKEDLWRLVGGTLRLRLTAHAIAVLPRACARETADTGAELSRRVESLGAFYAQLAAQVGRPGERPAAGLGVPSPAEVSGGEHLSSRHAIWLHEHLDRLSENLADLVTPANHLAAVRSRPWWR